MLYALDFLLSLYMYMSHNPYTHLPQSLRRRATALVEPSEIVGAVLLHIYNHITKFSPHSPHPTLRKVLLLPLNTPGHFKLQAHQHGLEGLL